MSKPRGYRMYFATAGSKEEAERLAVSGGLMNGYGVIDSREV